MGITFEAEDIKVLERMKKEPLGLQTGIPSLLPRKVCYIETGWDGNGGTRWEDGVWVSSPTT